MEIHAVNILYDFCIMSTLLFIAKLIRSKVKIIQKLYIPSSLLGGVIGLLLGKYFLNILPFSTEISNYSSILITILFATMFLGSKRKVSFKTMISNVGDSFLINGAAEIAQFGLFIIIGVLILPMFFKSINIGFGLLLPAGFVGGHGTAAAIGAAFADMGWDEATSIGQTFATIGLISGIVLGVIIINIGTRKGYTRLIKKIDELPEDMRTGLISKESRSSMGENTVSPMSIDPLTWHITLVLVAVGLAYLVNAGLSKVFPKLSFPVYGIALVMSIFLQGILGLFKLNQYVDKQVVTRVGSTATDYLVGFGIASIKINIVVKYWLPIVALSILGLVCVTLWQFVVSKRFFHNYWFERGIYIFGLTTGVMATGVILLRITDPEFKSGVLEDFGLAWIFLSIMDMMIVSLSPMFIGNGMGIAAGIVYCVIAIACLILSACLFGIQKDNGAVRRQGEITIDDYI